MKLNGIEVVDATEPCILSVRRHDAAVGKPRDPERCAAALAACRLPGVEEAHIYRSRAFFLKRNGRGKQQWIRYATPNSVRNELISLDRGGRFEPDDYIFRPVQASQRLGVFAGVNRGQTGPHNKKKPTPHIVKGIRRIGPRSGGNSTI